MPLFLCLEVGSSSPTDPEPSLFLGVLAAHAVAYNNAKSSFRARRRCLFPVDGALVFRPALWMGSRNANGISHQADA